MSEKKILVVEDLECSRQIVAFHLEKLGYKSILADNGEKALELSSQEQYDLILMDLEMPVMDGVKALKEIQTKGNPNRETPIIALTAYAENQKKFHRMGFKEVLSKPYQRSDIQEVLDRWLA